MVLILGSPAPPMQPDKGFASLIEDKKKNPHNLGTQD